MISIKITEEKIESKVKGNAIEIMCELSYITNEIIKSGINKGIFETREEAIDVLLATVDFHNQRDENDRR